MEMNCNFIGLSYMGNLDQVKYHISKGIKVDICFENKNTALMAASYSGAFKVVEYLLDKGANPKLRNKCEESALEMAIKNGNSLIVQTLLQYGAIITDECILLASERSFIGIRNLLVKWHNFEKLIHYPAYLYLRLSQSLAQNIIDDESKKFLYHEIKNRNVRRLLVSFGAKTDE